MPSLVSGMWPVPRTVLKPVTVTPFRVCVVTVSAFCANAAKGNAIVVANKICLSFIYLILRKGTLTKTKWTAISGKLFTHNGILHSYDKNTQQIEGLKPT